MSVPEPIPWQFTDEPGLLQWTWVTEHFLARIVGVEGRGVDGEGPRAVTAYRWELSDLMQRNQGMPRLLVEGAARRMEDAELQVREHVGKAYDPSLGYRRFAGVLTFMYTLANGERCDVSSYIGTNCAVTLLIAGGGERTISGEFQVRNYRILVRTRDQEFDVVPEHILRISNKSEAAEAAAKVVRLDTYAGVGRLYREEFRPGCTGRPGFTPATVDHAGAPRCPLHEEGLSEHLLK